MFEGIDGSSDEESLGSLEGIGEEEDLIGRMEHVGEERGEEKHTAASGEDAQQKRKDDVGKSGEQKGGDSTVVVV